MLPQQIFHGLLYSGWDFLFETAICAVKHDRQWFQPPDAAMVTFSKS